MERDFDLMLSLDLGSRIAQLARAFRFVSPLKLALFPTCTI